MNVETAYGINSARALIENVSGRVEKLYVLEDRSSARLTQLVELAARRNVHAKTCTRKEFERHLESHHIPVQELHQGVLICFRPSEPRDERWLYSYLEDFSCPLLLVLDGVTDPHNLGACIRSACAAGVQAVVVPQDRSVKLTPVVRKVASGAAEITPLVVVKNLARALERFRALNIWVMGAAGEAKSSLYELDLKGGLAMVLGAEGDGMRRLTRDGCDQLFSIPMSENIESLNVSVATGICLFEANRQRLGLSSR